MAFIGPSYDLRSPIASLQRTIGMVPVPIEPGNERTPWVFKDVPGLAQFCNVGAAIRGIYEINGRVFVVGGDKLYELASDGTKTERGTLVSNTGFVGIKSNGLQLAVSDAVNLYVMTLVDNSFASVAFPGKAKIAYLNQRILFVYRDSQQFGWTNIADASEIGALSFASAESAPDDTISIEVDHSEAFLFGAKTGEPWQNTPSASIFERNTGGVWEIGSTSEFSIQKIDNATFWLARTDSGQGAVYRLNVYQPQRVSTQAIEEMMTGLDLSQASAYTYEDEKSSFYCLNVPGLATTLVYDVFSGQWHERAELVNGEFTKHRATCHAFAFDKHLFGADDGIVYRSGHDLYTNDGDPLVRERVTPITSTPGRKRIHPYEFWLDCERGTGGQVMLRYSINCGRTWSNWKSKSVGEIGVYNKQLRWRRLNAGKDFVVQVRCTDNVPFNPVAGELA